jgi:uncharacterized metal-binding protein YceD (DUF177 family)
MPDLISQSPSNPQFARVLVVSRLREVAEFTFDIAPDDAERQALARLMKAQEVRKLRLKGRLTAAGGGAWALEAELGATVVQTCVVTLEPVTTRLDLPVRRRFVPGAAAAATDITVAPLDEDEVEPLGDTIDLGLVATEALALGLPDYPRSTGATLARDSVTPPGAEPLEAGKERPFAALASLRDKLRGSS